MTILDNLIGWFDPAAGVRRVMARQALTQVRAFEGAKRGRRTSGWQTTNAGANAENMMALTMLRNRSRDLVRNNPWCKHAKESWLGNAIGEGVRCNLEADPVLGPLWRQWAETTACDADGDSNLYGLQALSAGTSWESGEALIRLRWRRLSDGLPVPLQLQVLEPDYLDQDKNEDLPNGGVIIAGKQFNAIGKLTGYWFFDRHPGESSRLFRSPNSSFVDARDVIHLFKKTRPGQVRGVPELAPVIMRARDLDDYEDAELTRKKIEACFTAFVTSGDAGGSSVGAIGERSRDGANPSRNNEKVAPGMIKRLGMGEEVTFAQPTPIAGYPDYTRTQLRAIAAGTLVTYEQLTGDYSQVNYSSSRAGLLEFRRMVSAWQWLTFAPKVCDPIATAFLRAAAMAGVTSKPEKTIDWTTPRWDWVDPVKDVVGELLEVAAGGKSLSEFVRRRGYDPQVVRSELAADYKELADLGIPINLNNLISLAAGGIGDTKQEDKTNA